MVNISKIFNILIFLKRMNSYILIFLFFLSFFLQNITFLFIPRRLESTCLTILITSDIEFGTFVYIWKYNTSNWTWSHLYWYGWSCLLHISNDHRIQSPSFLFTGFDVPKWYLPKPSFILRFWHGAHSQYVHQVAVEKRWILI